MRYQSIAVVVTLLAIGVTSTPAAAQHDASAQAHTAPQQNVSAQLFTPQDLMFLHHMIMHHEQAVVMAPMVAEKSSHEEFIRFADYVGRAQAAEIDQMQSLLDLARERGLEVPQHRPQGDPPMAGMLSSAQMAALEAATGDEFDRLWLEGMIFHHQGAIDMSHTQQRHQLETGRRPFALSVLVEDIIEEQRNEITKMRGWLEEWGLVGAW